MLDKYIKGYIIYTGGRKTMLLRVFGLLAIAVFSVGCTGKRVTVSPVPTAPVTKASVPKGICDKDGADKVACAYAKRERAKKEVEDANKILRSQATPEEIKGLNKAEKIEKFKEKLSQDRIGVLQNAAISGCEKDWQEKFGIKEYDVTSLLFNGASVTALGYTVKDSTLYVVSEEGVLVHPKATGQASWSPWGLLIVQNVSAIPVNITFKNMGRVVVQNLCPGGRITLFAEIDQWKKGASYTMNASWSASGRFPDGNIGTADSGSLYLDVSTTTNRNGEVMTWYINLQKQIPQYK